MSTSDPTFRLLAAGSGLGGLGYMMWHPAPSTETVLVGLASLVLCVGFSAVPGPKKPPRPAATRPQPVAPRPLPVPTGPQPHQLLLMEVPQRAAQLPGEPTHRQRTDDRQVPRNP